MADNTSAAGNHVLDAPAAKNMRPEYDLRGGDRVRYYERYKQGTSVVVLKPESATGDAPESSADHLKKT